MKTGLIVPTLNAGNRWQEWIESFQRQIVRPDFLLDIDSSSHDDTVFLAQHAGFAGYKIQKYEFNHGGTRQLGVNLLNDADIIIFLTQDAVLANHEALKKIVSIFEDSKVGAAYGRQLPRKDANHIEAHARLFNYPPVSQVKTMGDAPKLGIKTAFISNSFAAYRRKALEEVGGFPPDTIFGEDTYVAAKMLMAGWKVAYCADATVYHSHSYGLLEEFKRYFDIGVFHSREAWIRQNFGQAEGEGLRYIKSELNYLWNKRPQLIPFAVLRTLFKFIGYKLGALERFIPIWLKSILSMNKIYWERETKRVRN